MSAQLLNHVAERYWNMMISYTYPIVYFYGDDLEDSEIIHKEGHIKPVQLEREPFEADVNAEGSSFHIVFGSHCNGNFLCIPNWHVGCELAKLTDIQWNLESLMGDDESFYYDNATAVAYALNEINKIINL